jgi:hypothetical protein
VDPLAANREDKFFFFGSYEGYRLRSSVNFIEAVPSAWQIECGRRGSTAVCTFRDPKAVVLPALRRIQFR